ncbi:hypothetical protein [Paenibacillus beijingensis]|nr:hypothetical protein [Paenibacillus beijingensis]
MQTEQPLFDHPSAKDIRRLMISNAKETIALADSSKFGGVAFFRFAEVDELGYLITDPKTDIEAIRKLEQAGVKATGS